MNNKISEVSDRISNLERVARVLNYHNNNAEFKRLILEINHKRNQLENKKIKFDNCEDNLLPDLKIGFEKSINNIDESLIRALKKLK